MEFNIALLPGDGIGPEIMNEAVKIASTVAGKFSHKISFMSGLVGADAIEKTGEPYPEETHRLCMQADAVLFGAIGHPKYDNDPGARVRPEQGLLAMRKKLGLYANIRPVFTYPSLLEKSPLKNQLVNEVDFIVVRELTGGIYFGKPSGRSEDGDTAYDTNIYTRGEIERILKVAYDMAEKRSGRLTVVDKANVLATSRLWREIALEMAKKHKKVKTGFLFVDNAAMQIVLNPAQFDVMVTENMFGDILSDEAGAITGSLGLMPSASFGTHTSVYEPIHGSYPQAAGKNIANPLAMILSVAMMFEYSLKMPEAANLIRNAVSASVVNKTVTADIAEGHAYSTSETGEWINHYLKRQKRF